MIRRWVLREAMIRRIEVSRGVIDYINHRLDSGSWRFHSFSHSIYLSQYSFFTYYQYTYTTHDSGNAIQTHHLRYLCSNPRTRVSCHLHLDVAFILRPQQLHTTALLRRLQRH